MFTKVKITNQMWDFPHCSQLIPSSSFLESRVYNAHHGALFWWAPLSIPHVGHIFHTYRQPGLLFMQPPSFTLPQWKKITEILMLLSANRTGPYSWQQVLCIFVNHSVTYSGHSLFMKWISEWMNGIRFSAERTEKPCPRIRNYCKVLLNAIQCKPGISILSRVAIPHFLSLRHIFFWESDESYTYPL